MAADSSSDQAMRFYAMQEQQHDILSDRPDESNKGRPVSDRNMAREVVYKRLAEDIWQLADQKEKYQRHKDFLL
jgi:hypothetical protein